MSVYYNSVGEGWFKKKDNIVNEGVFYDDNDGVFDKKDWYIIEKDVQEIANQTSSAIMKLEWLQENHINPLLDSLKKPEKFKELYVENKSKLLKLKKEMEILGQGHIVNIINELKRVLDKVK